MGKRREEESKEPVEIEMYLHHKTDKAYLLSDDGEEDNAKWFGMSLVKIEHRHKLNKQIVHVTMPEWLAIKEGLV